jgi:hypothetical protein
VNLGFWVASGKFDPFTFGISGSWYLGPRACRADIFHKRRLAAISVHCMIEAAEAHRFVGPLLQSRRDLCGPQLDVLLSEGSAVTQSNYVSALEARQKRLKSLTAGQASSMPSSPCRRSVRPLQSKPPVIPVSAPDGPSARSGAHTSHRPEANGPAAGAQLVEHRGTDPGLIAVAMARIDQASSRPPSVPNGRGVEIVALAQGAAVSCGTPCSMW